MIYELVGGSFMDYISLNLGQGSAEAFHILKVEQLTGQLYEKLGAVGKTVER
jgi:hypothetical protein